MRVESIAEDVPIVPPIENVPFDPTAVVSDDDEEDDAKLDAAGPSRSFPSLRDMMQTFMMTDTAYGQLLDELITEVVALRSDFTEYWRSFPPPPPSDL